MTLLLDEVAVRMRSAGIVAVTGHDRLAYLHSLFSQQFEGVTPGSVTDFLYLDPKGNAKAVGRAAVRAGDVLLMTPPEVAADLTEALRQFPFMLDARAEDLSQDWALASIRGPGPVVTPGARSEPMTAAPHGGGLVIRDRSGGVDLVGERGWLERTVADLDLPVAGQDDWEAWRIGAGETAWGAEVVPGRRPQELGLLPTHVHLRKGCYAGQESIAKIYNLGRTNRALAVLEAPAPLVPGDPVEAAGKTGEVTSAAAQGEAWVALALVPLDADGALPGDQLVSVGGRPARIRRRVGEGLAQPGAGPDAPGPKRVSLRR
jgi:folate-binding protein YgfZ